MNTGNLDQITPKNLHEIAISYNMRKRTEVKEFCNFFLLPLFKREAEIGKLTYTVSKKELADKDIVLVAQALDEMKWDVCCDGSIIVVKW